MNRFYIITPLVLMAVFSAIFWQHSKSSAVKEQAEAARVEQTRLELENKKKEAIEKARADSEKRTAARLAEEQQREDEKRAKWTEAGDRIASEIAANQALQTKHAEAIQALEAELAAARTAKEKSAERAFAMTHAIEKNRIAKRAVEMEIQRLTEMVARTAAGTSIASVP